MLLHAAIDGYYYTLRDVAATQSLTEWLVAATVLWSAGIAGSSINRSPDLAT